MIPWFIVYCMILIACAGAIRIATAHTPSQHNDLMGTIDRAALTLEEATHGPDVAWRPFVMDSPLFAGIFFLVFLWVVTIVLFNILIAMFTSTFERIRTHAFQQYMHKRAVEIIVYEKIIPTWLHNALGLTVGINLHQPRNDYQHHPKRGLAMSRLHSDADLEEDDP